MLARSPAFLAIALLCVLCASAVADDDDDDDFGPTTHVKMGGPPETFAQGKGGTYPAEPYVPKSPPASNGLAARLRPPPPGITVTLPVGGKAGDTHYIDPGVYTKENTFVVVADWKNGADNGSKGEPGAVESADRVFRARGHAVHIVGNPQQLQDAQAAFQRALLANPDMRLIILGHGVPGRAQFGPNYYLTAENAAEWGAGFRGARETLFVSCSFGGNPEPARLFAQESGSHVLASTEDMTGTHNYGFTLWRTGVDGDSKWVHATRMPVAWAKTETEIIDPLKRIENPKVVQVIEPTRTPRPVRTVAPQTWLDVPPRGPSPLPVVNTPVAIALVTGVGVGGGGGVGPGSGIVGGTGGRGPVSYFPPGGGGGFGGGGGGGGGSDDTSASAGGNVPAVAAELKAPAIAPAPPAAEPPPGSYLPLAKAPPAPLPAKNPSPGATAPPVSPPILATIRQILTVRPRTAPIVVPH